jgi:copper chaperone CopZ
MARRLGLILILFLSSALAGAEKITLSVPAIMCMSCISKVKAAVRKNNAENIFVSIESHEATFSCDKSRGCDVEKILQDLKKAKYKASVLKKE